MIYIHNNSAQEIRIPRNGDFAGTAYFILRGATTRKETIAVRVEDNGTSNQYFCFSASTLPTIKHGQYEYILEIGGEIASNGLAVVGNYVPESEEYKNMTVYEQYNG